MNLLKKVIDSRRYETADFSGEPITELVADTIGDKDLYARWELITYSITYHLDGGVNNASNPDKYAINLPLTLAAPTKEGHIFLGWYETADFSGEAVTKIVAGTTVIKNSMHASNKL